jgi:hypothetical protein
MPSRISFSLGPNSPNVAANRTGSGISLGGDSAEDELLLLLLLLVPLMLLALLVAGL